MTLRNMGEMVRVRTVTLLLALLWGISFAFGAYEIYAAWIEHRGPHGSGAIPPLGLPELPADYPLTKRPQMQLGT
jgi:hypothetical protein